MPVDDFNRANGGLGANWTQLGSWAALILNANQVVPQNAGTENAAYYSAWTPSSADQYAEVRVVAYGNGGPLVRVNPAGPTGYLAAGSQFSTTLYRIVGGAYTSIGTGPALQDSGGVGLILRCEAEGSTIRLIYNAVTLISATDTAITDAGSVGLYDYHNATGAYDDWAAEILGAGAGGPRYYRRRR